MKILIPIVLGLIGAVLICFGSIVAIAAPGDGQTGMVTFPLWLLGGCAGVAAIVFALKEPRSIGVLVCVAVFAAAAVGSVVSSFVASSRYSSEWERKHNTSTRGE